MGLSADEIEFMQKNGDLKGRGNGLELDSFVTRAEALTLLLRTCDEENLALNDEENSDVNNNVKRVIFDANGGSGAPINQIKYYNEIHRHKHHKMKRKFSFKFFSFPLFFLFFSLKNFHFSLIFFLVVLQVVFPS